VYERLGIEHVIYALDAQLQGEQPYLWDIGQIITYYLFAVSAIWLGWRFETHKRKPNHHMPSNKGG
jgi:hypothetical protein